MVFQQKILKNETGQNFKKTSESFWQAMYVVHHIQNLMIFTEVKIIKFLLLGQPQTPSKNSHSEFLLSPLFSGLLRLHSEAFLLAQSTSICKILRFIDSQVFVKSHGLCPILFHSFA